MNILLTASAELLRSCLVSRMPSFSISTGASIVLRFAGVCLVTLTVTANVSATVVPIPADTTTGTDSIVMNSDAIYSRPFVQRSSGALAVGGYAEANVQQQSSAGASSGVHFQARRFTLFLAGNPSASLRFLAEVEFENGTEEINLEFASMDVILSRMFILRGGILMIPIGGFNQNHDGPRWNFIDRPISATQLLPATWSAVGLGMLGKIRLPVGLMSYELYASNGLDESIVQNDSRRTSLTAAKENQRRFAESPTGKVMISGRTALALRSLGEVGLSYAGGSYSQTQGGTVSIGPDLWHHCAAIDYSNGSFATPWYVRAEGVFISVNLPNAAEPVYASRQAGGYVDVNHAVWRGSLLGFHDGALFLGIRGEYADFHLAQPSDKGASGDEAYSYTIALAFHPVSGSIIRANYRHLWQSDVLGNEAVATGIIQLGVTTYF